MATLAHTQNELVVRVAEKAIGERAAANADTQDDAKMASLANTQNVPALRTRWKWLCLPTLRTRSR